MRLKAEGDLAVGVQLGPQLERVLGGLTLALQPAPAPQATQATPAGEDQDLKPMSSREPSQPHVLSEFQELQRKYDALVVEFGKFKETCTSCDDSLISSEFTDSSSSFLNTPDPHAKANARLYVASTEEEEEEKLRTIKPLIYAQPHTDSSNTPSPEKLPIYKKRRKKKLSPQRLCTITSDSDSGDCFKIRQRRPRESLATHFRTYCFSQSECDYSSPVSGDEHSSSDSAVGGMFPSDSQVDNQLALPSASLLESLPGWKLCARETKRKFRQKNTNLDKFFTPNGELDMKLFMPWLCSIVNQSGGYKHVISVIPQHFFTAFGFSRLRHKRLTPKEKKIAHAIFCFVKNTKQHIPERVKENLAVLKKVLEAGVFRGKKPRNNAPLRVTPKPLPQTRTHNESTPHEIEPHPQTHEGRHRYEGDSVTDGVAGPSPTDPQSRTPPTSESSAGVSVLDFASTSNPLDVICTHMKKFGSCCPRHDIRNIVTMGTTFPASDAFGPKRRYCTIKDLHSNPGHSQFDSTQKLSAQSSSKRRCYRNGESHQVMFDNRGALLTQLHPPRESQTLAETASPHPSLSSSKLRPQTLSHTHHQSKVTSDITTGSTYHQETSVVETLQANPEPSRRQTSVVETLQTNPEQNRRVDVATHIPLFDSTIVPEDHKQRLRSTAELLHAQDYTRILTLSYDGDPPSFLPPDLRIPYVFITGLAYYKLSNHKKSIQYFAQCLRLADECRRKGDITICNIYIGDIEFAKRRYTEAAGRYQSALESYSRESVAVDFQMVMPTRSAVWLKCGSAFKNASRVGAAVAAYEKAIELASSKKDELSAHTSLGNLYQGIGENGRAVKEYEAAIELAQELKDNVSLGWNHGNLGNALLGLHQRDKALHHLFKALDMAVDYETTPQAIGRAYNNLGTAYQSLNELGKAEEHYDLALSQAIYGNDIPGQARVYGNIGNLQMLNKQYDRAVPHYTEVMRLSQDKATITTAHHNRGCAYYDWAEKKKQASMPQDGVHGRENDMHGLQDVARGGKRPTSCLEIEVKGRGHSRLQADIASDTTSAAANDDQSPAPDSHFKVSLHGPDFEDCEEIYRPYDVPEAIQKYYLQGTRDLEYVIKHHEENFSGIKGSPKGLSLSVSLFETNSRTFHRMQDCLVHLEGEEHATRFRDALHVAEKSRARTLGELMMKRRGPQLTKFDLQSPPTLENMETIVGQQSCPVIYLSYTGERLLGWLLYPTPGTQTCSINMFEVPLSDNEFDGKSLDYHLRYSLNEQLVEKSFEMYKPFDHERDKTEPLEKLYDLVARPVMKMLEHLDEENEEKMKVAGRQQHKHEQKTEKKTEVRKIIVIPDSYTNLLPLTCTFDKTTRKFWGDHFYFQIMPSLLTMGILDQLPTVSVSIPVQYQQMLCVVGNPNIPRFKFNNEEWDLGKLPHATREAEWVSHILQCNPILHEQATKDAVMMRVMNAKVIHLATHGSAVAGFLAFAGISSSSSEAVDAKRVLIYPDEVESLNISPALVVLSSCDSGRGVFKADGIQGMARAFILAGAQAVLTALWRVPDESACIFMQFFYQYLVEGMRGTEALHKAILCLRCFSKYSQYIHWSGYQLTGREFQFNVSQTSARAELSTRLGVSSIFPRLEILKELKKAFLESPRLPTDVQVLQGPPGVKPSEPLIDFIHSHHAHFSGGIFWINCRTPQLIDTSLTSIQHLLGLNFLSELSPIESQPILVVLDSLSHFPKNDCHLLSLLKQPNVHIAVISKNALPGTLQESAHHQLIRGTNVLNIQPLSTIHATQRLVHSVVQNHHLAPGRKEQELFGRLAEFTTGSPPILELTSSLLNHSLQQAQCNTEDTLETFASEVKLTELPLQKPVSVPKASSMPPEEVFVPVRARNISRELYDTVTQEDEDDVFSTSAEYDSWQVVTVLIDRCNLSPEERLLLFCLSSFSCCPIPTSYVTELATIITKASHQPHLASSLHVKLQNNKMLKVYPKPLVYHPNIHASNSDVDFVYVPRFISTAVWKDMMSEIDKVMALTTCYRALRNSADHFASTSSSSSQQQATAEELHLLGVGSILVESFQLNFKLVGRSCFQELFSLFLRLHPKNTLLEK